MSLYFSNAPRDFPHQSRGNVIPQVIAGTRKRLDEGKNTAGDWGRLIERTSDFQVCSDPRKQTDYRKKMVEDIQKGQRNIFPQEEVNNIGSIHAYKTDWYFEDVEGPARFEKKVFPEVMANSNNSGGIINQLSRQDTGKYVPHKAILNIQHQQSTTDIEFKSAKKSNSYADSLYFSQIKQLPGQAFREGQELKMTGQIEERNRGLQQLGQRSQIDNLPCSSYGKVSRQDDRPPKADAYRAHFQNTTPELYNDSQLVEQNFYREQPHTVENDKHCEKEYDIIADNVPLKRFPEKRDNLYRVAFLEEKVNPDSITGNRKKKAYNDPFHSHFQLG